MLSLRVAVVSRDPEVRLAAARAFDAAPPSWQVELHASVPASADVVVFTPDAPGPGITFDPAAPERVLREVESAAARARSRLVVVTAPSGGTGATTLALHLARECAASGAATCFVDLDIRWGAGDRLGLNGDARTWGQLGDDEDSLGLCALPVAGGFRALLSPREEGATTSSEGVQAMLRRIGDRFERVIVDAPNNALLGAALACAQAAVTVVAPTLPAAGRTCDFLAAHEDVAWAVVTNRLGPGGETRRARLEAQLGRRIALELPCAPSLRDAEDDSRLVPAAWSRWCRAVSRLASALELS